MKTETKPPEVYEPYTGTAYAVLRRNGQYTPIAFVIEEGIVVEEIEGPGDVFVMAEAAICKQMRAQSNQGAA